MTQPIPVLGIVGGIGSGKSTMTAWLAQRLRLAVLDADAVGHAVLRLPEVKQSLRETFGPEIFDAAGEVRRPQLGRLVFGDDAQHLAARRRLEVVVHPVIRDRLEAGIVRLRGLGNCDLIVLDAAILFEAGWNNVCDAVVFVDAPRPLRLKRVRAARGWTDEELARRERSQWSLDRKRAAADVVVSNDADIDSTGRKLLNYLRGRFPQQFRTLGDPQSAPVAPDASLAIHG